MSEGEGWEREEVVGLLSEARARTLLLIAPLSPEDLRIQHSPLMSPIVWDLGHIAHFEEVWLLTRAGRSSGEASEGLAGTFNPFENPRNTRGQLELPCRGEALEYLARVRRSVLDRLDELAPDPSDPLLRAGYVLRLVLQHEYQHNETILQTLQLKRGEPYPAPRSIALPHPGPAWRERAGEMVRCPGGRVEVGTNDRSVAYDNERPRHDVELAPFLIDVAPVTNGEYLAFIEAGGYVDRAFWSDAGWAWLQDEAVEAPASWRREGEGRWSIRSMDRREELRPLDPVCHVSYHEACAYARYADKRLPTELEWEAAATWDFERGEKLHFPWGERAPEPTLANVDQVSFQTAPLGSYPSNVSPIGCYGMIGDVWEWTSSDFEGYPGFESFPYPEYSEVFFGSEQKVLRGGSWATRAGALRSTFRNWDFPARRQIFAGFRCAKDTER